MSEIIIVSRSELFRSKCASLLANENLQFSFAESEDELMRQLRSRRVGLVIVKSGRTEPECHHVIDLVREHRPGISVILSADYFDFWSDFSTWVADACVVESGDLSELKSLVHDLASANKDDGSSSEEFPVDWS